jgi:hypothetical protein
MVRASLGLVVATIGRPTLSCLLNSIKRQEHLPGDQVILAVDGPKYEVSVQDQLAASQLADTWDVRLFLLPDGPHKDVGMTPRNRAMPLVTSNYLMFNDDDDEYLVNAFRNIRNRIETHPNVPLLFRMYQARLRGFIWGTREVRDGNVATQMIVTPNVPGKIGVWKEGLYNGDLYFIRSTLERYPPGSVVWCEEVVTYYDVTK